MNYFNMRSLIVSKNIKQFIRYCIVGISNTFVGLGTIFVLYNVFHIDYRLSNLAGYILGLINSYMWNKLWTFGSKQKSYREIILFIFVFVISYIFNLSVVIFSAEILGINKNICQLMGMVIYTTSGFIGNKFCTFRKIK